MHEPGHKYLRDGREISFYSRQSVHTGGMLDVDMNAGGPRSREPVENIFYANRRRMTEGEYTLFVHQYARRETDNVGFEVEVDWLGDVKRFHYEKPVTGKVVVARFRYPQDSSSRQAGDSDLRAHRGPRRHGRPHPRGGGHARHVDSVDGDRPLLRLRSEVQAHRGAGHRVHPGRPPRVSPLLLLRFRKRSALKDSMR
jgi:hypothetical protein